MLFTVSTSTLGWDTGRAITNAIAIATIGRPVLATLRRARRKAAFDQPTTFAKGGTVGTKVELTGSSSVGGG